MAKFAYTNKKEVKVTKPKPPKFSYSSKSQVKITKPNKPRKESLGEIAQHILFEKQTKELTVLNPKTKNRIKVKSALEYPKNHPAYLAAIALLKKKNVTLPANIHKVKPGETIPLFDLRPYEDPRKASIAKIGAALSETGAEEYLTETQGEYIRKLGYDGRNGIETYTGSGYTYMNSYLRGNTDSAYDMFASNMSEDEEPDYDYFDDQINSAIAELDSAFEGNGAILQNDVLVYRGIDSDSGILEEVIDGGTGTIISDSGFISTSIDDSVAKKFAGATGTLLKIVARKGTRALYPLAANMGQSDENEVIINRDSKMRVISIDKEKVKMASTVLGKYKERYVITVETILEGEKE